MKRIFFPRVAFLIVLGILVFIGRFSAQAVSIVDTKHNLSVTGPGQVKALTETRVCIFCHTPHNANPRTPLWNRDVGSQSYVLYSSTTIQAVPMQPNGPSRLCLSCHDGTIALGAVLMPTGGISMMGQISPGGPSNIGANLSLSGEHPISFSYSDSQARNPEINPGPPADLVFYGPSSYIECPTCHDAHHDDYRSLDKTGQLTGKFLVSDNRYSALCLQCHNPPNWIGSPHQASTAFVDKTVFPMAPRTWPNWDYVNEWGCEICHTSHSSPSGQWLLYYPTEAEVCFPCHGAAPPAGSPHGSSMPAPSAVPASAAGRTTAVATFAVATPDVRAGVLTTATGTIAAKRRPSKNIAAQTQKISAHRMSGTPLSILRRSRTSLAGKMLPLAGQTMSLEVTCSDCHEPHIKSGPAASSRVNGRITGSIAGASGVDRNGVGVATATYEYEVCFKCHADYSGQVLFVPRVISTTNTRLQFETLNPSFHPVEERGKNPNVPSIPSTFEPTLTVSSTIYCTDCHSDDGGSKGPHGSSFPPILKERYETADNTSETYQNYALCYRCHNRSSILSDVSFRKKIVKTTTTGGGHSGHLAKGAPCSVCHDAHGVNVTTGFASGTGDHTSLINFDIRTVTAKSGASFPSFTKNGIFSGSCTLVCHGRVHNNETYP